MKPNHCHPYAPWPRGAGRRGERAPPRAEREGGRREDASPPGAERGEQVEPRTAKHRHAGARSGHRHGPARPGGGREGARAGGGAGWSESGSAAAQGGRELGPAPVWKEEGRHPPEQRREREREREREGGSNGRR